MNSNKKPGQFKPAVAQLKTPVSAQSIKRPVAPPVYRPQPQPKCAQAKMAPAANAVVNRKPVSAPPVYRPQPVPKVLQAKSSPIRNPHVRPTAPIARTIQRTPEESKNLKMLGLMWNKHAESNKDGKAKVRFFEHIKEIKEKLNFNVYTVWHKHDLYVGGGKNKNYVKIVAALQGADAGKTSADTYIAWAEGGTSITDLPNELQELVLIVHIAEVGRMYLDAPDKILYFMKEVSAASKPERVELWKNFKNYNEFAFTAKEDPEYVPDAEMSDDD